MMRRADPNELTTGAIPVLTARLSEAELAQWVPVDFDLIEDPQETPEPSLGALVALDSGDYVVLYYGKISGQLTVEIPSAADPTTVIDAFFEEIPLPPRSVLWHRPDLQLPTRRWDRVLIADADPALRQQMVTGLLERDIFADCVGSFEDAALMISRESYRVVILDTSFPPAELKHLMRGLSNLLPQERPIVVALSGDESADESLDVDVVQVVIRKPLNLRQLQEVIGSFFEQPQQLLGSMASAHTSMGRNRRPS